MNQSRNVTFNVKNNKITLHNVKQHTIIAKTKQIVPEHLDHLNQQKSTNTQVLQCMHSPNSKPCNCPTHANCPLLIATRSQIIFSQLPLAQQIIIPFKRNEPELLRRLPPSQYTDKSIHRPNTIKDSTKPLDDDQNVTPTIKQQDQNITIQRPNFLKDSFKSFDQNYDDQNVIPATITIKPRDLPKSEYLREEKLLRKLIEKEERTGRPEGGITVNGLRLGARETLRRLLAIGPSQAEVKEKVPRIWFIHIPRGFEDMAVPYTIERANYDSLVYISEQMVPIEIDLVPEWFPSGWSGRLAG